MTISITKLCDLLSAKVGKDAAETLTVYIEEKIKDQFADISKMPATKEDLCKYKSRNHQMHVYLFDRAGGSYIRIYTFIFEEIIRLLISANIKTIA